MAWPPAVVCRRIALVIFGLSLMLYTALSGLLFALGLDARMTVIVGQFVVLFGLSLGLARLMRIPLREAFALRPAARAHWVMVLAAALPLQVAGGAMQFALVRRLPEDSELRRLMEQVLDQFIAVDTPFDALLLVLAAVVTAAICEEFLFRGLLMHLMQRRAGWRSAIAWSSVMFALYHLNPLVLLPIALVGAYLAVLVWRSGSLYPAILAHGLNNGLALFGVPYVADEAVYADYLALILASSSILLGVLLWGYLRFTPEPAGAAVAPDALLATETLASRGPGGFEGDRVDGRLGDGQQAQHPE
jgi:membrane protease YdiL (CAAX protease family)